VNLDISEIYIQNVYNLYILLYKYRTPIRIKICITVTIIPKHNRSGMVAVLGPVEALPCYIHTYIHTIIPRFQGLVVLPISVQNFLLNPWKKNRHCKAFTYTRQHKKGEGWKNIYALSAIRARVSSGRRKYVP
jgi:hypothetical protein